MRVKGRRRPPGPWASLDERRAWGRSLRVVVKRPDQGAWKAPADRPDPVALIEATNAERLPDLVPLKMGRMAASPFGFFRGAAPVMAQDLAGLPATGVNVQLCGDAHIRNLGAFAAPDGHLVFDINDFDETIPGPWEWDLKRLATSVVLAGREAGDSDALCVDAVRALVSAYRGVLDQFSRMPALELARFAITHEVSHGPTAAILAKAERSTPGHALEKLTKPARGGFPHFHDMYPVLRHVPQRTARLVLDSLATYRDTVGHDRQLVLDAYRPVDVAFKVVGTGSVGTRDYVVLMFGIGPGDPLVLQVKEEVASCYTPFLPGVPPYSHQGQRVAQGQHRMQTVSDPFLGWTTIEGRGYLVRQLCDHKASVDPESLQGRALVGYAEACGKVFAKAHARTGDGAAIAGYCGGAPRLDKALAAFAVAYADQTTEDHALFLRAIKAGRIWAASEAALRRRRGRRRPGR